VHFRLAVYKNVQKRIIGEREGMMI